MVLYYLPPERCWGWSFCCPVVFIIFRISHYQAFTKGRKPTKPTIVEISDESIKELQDLHHRMTGEVLSLEETRLMGENLFRLFQAIYRPISRRVLEGQKEQFPELYKLLLTDFGSNDEERTIGFKP